MSSRRSLAVTLVALALASAACDRASAPTVPVAPAARTSSVDLSYTLLVAGTAQSTATVLATMGSGGGTLSVNGHTLAVPAGAVSRATTFRLGTVSGSTIEVELSATDAESGTPVTVFPVPLRLSLSYAGTKVKNPNRLKVAWVANDQILAVQASEVDRSHKLVTSSLYHFTGWAIAY